MKIIIKTCLCKPSLSKCPIEGSYRVHHATFARPSWDTFYFEIARLWHECGATIAEILRRSINLKLTLMKYIHYFVIIRLYSFQSFRWISFSYFTDFVGFCFRFVSFLFVSFLSLPVPNLEWELLKNVEIRKSKYARITHSIRGPPFREFCLYQEKSHIFSSENCTVY